MPEDADRNQLLDGEGSVCNYHRDEKDAEGHDCPFGGAKECADCVYSVDCDVSLCDGKGTEKHECPFGGDIANDCADCVYSGDYHYDYDEEDCIAR